MGTHSPGPIGKLLVGSVAEAVLRTARYAGLRDRPRGGERQVSQLCHAHDSVRREPA